MFKIRLPTVSIQEICALTGFFMVGYGLYQIYPPLMWIICGIWLVIPPKKKKGGV